MTNLTSLKRSLFRINLLLSLIVGLAVCQFSSATLIGSFRLDYEYEIEYEYDFRISNQ